ncbi:MAG: hypothetical protein ACE5E6_00195 [Phycisphaerae bacterium]
MGIRVGDRLVAFDAHAITSPNDFASLLGAYSADRRGGGSGVIVARGGVERRVVTKLEPLPLTPNAPRSKRTHVRRIPVRHRYIAE